ncbi:hypothetical protein BGX23_006121 [Mortierella sp. AD031]|nr:hypothetical protein BGX23_006121 [Mortierella sp. AD031]
MSSSSNNAAQQSTHQTPSDAPPHVLIVGAGLAGLFLGILLEKAGIPYDIFERTTNIKSIGAIMSLAATVMPVLEQASIYDGLLKISKPAALGTFYNDKLEVISVVDPTRADVLGYDRAMFTRPDLYNLLFKQIPSHKIHLSKKLVSFEEDDEGVKVDFGNGDIFQGDILVGADGAHSKVREHLYKTLEQQGLLPKADTRSAVKGYVCLIGTTDALDPIKYPSLAEPDCETSFIVGDKNTPYSWSTYTIPDNRICWSVTIQLDAAAIEKEQSGSPSDWLPQENQALMDNLRDFKTPYGPLGDLFNATQKEHISKVFLEDMFYETWAHGRTVLIGDAAHKILPSSGQGAVNAIHDAAILANRLYDIHPTTFATIKTALQDYKNERYDIVKDQYAQSRFSAMLLYGQSLTERLLRYAVLNWVPASMQSRQIVKDSAYRPQVNFLPQVPHRGSSTVPVISQKPSKRANKDQTKKTIAATASSTATAPVAAV